MDIIFYKLQDEVNDVKKLRTLTAREDYTPLQVSGTLKGATSKVAPSIDFSKPVNYFNGYNYCYIADFNRYYFVTDIISNRNDYSTVNLRVDVLTSFLTQPNYTNLTGFVGRCSNENRYDNFIPDNKVQFRGEKYVEVVEPQSISGNIENITFSVNATDNILVSTTNVEDLAPYNDVTIQSELQFLVKGSQTINKDFFKPRGNNYIYVTGTGDSQTAQGNPPVTADRILWFLNYCGGKDDAQSFVNNVIVYPFSIPHDSIYKDVKLVKDLVFLIGTTGDVLQMRSGTQSNSGYLVLKDFILSETGVTHFSNNFTKYEPYTTCEIFIPFVSWVNIDLRKNLNCRIMVVYNIDYTSGQSTVYLINKTRNEIIYQTNAKVGIEVPVNTTNLKENELKDQNYTRNYFAGMLTSFTMGAIGAATLNPYMAVAGLTGVAMTTVQYINNENLLLDKGQGQTVPPTTTSAMLSGLQVLVRWTKVISVNFDTAQQQTDFANRLGIPTNKILRLVEIPDLNYHTYAEITDLHTTSENGLNSLSDITLSETEELKTLCSQGIYL